MRINSKTAQLLAALATTSVTVSVDGYGNVRIRQISVAESDEVAAIARANKEGSPSEFGLNLLVRAVLDEDGVPLFDDTDLPALRACAGTKVDALVGKVLEVNKFKKAEDEKNSPTPPIASSATA
jgi:hypothetical protein